MEAPVRIVLLLLLALPSLLVAQPYSSADSARTALFARHLVPTKSVELRLADRRMVVGRLVDRRRDSLLIRDGPRLDIVALNQIVAAWVRKSSSSRDGLIGAGIGAVGLGAFFGLAGKAAVQEGASPGTFPEAILAGVLIGGAIGGAVGAVVGSRDSAWCQVMEGLRHRPRPCGP